MRPSAAESGDYEQARRFYEDALSVARETGNRPEQARAHAGLSDGPSDAQRSAG